MDGEGWVRDVADEPVMDDFLVQDVDDSSPSYLLVQDVGLTFLCLDTGENVLFQDGLRVERRCAGELREMADLVDFEVLSKVLVFLSVCGVCVGWLFLREKEKGCL
jgi:hypothetical protein